MDNQEISINLSIKEVEMLLDALFLKHDEFWEKMIALEGVNGRDHEKRDKLISKLLNYKLEA